MKAPSKQQIDAWKAKHGTVFQVNSGDKMAFLKKPDRKIMKMVSSVSDPVEMNETLLNNCWIDGDKEIKTDDEHFFAVSGQLAELVQIKEASIKKL